MVTEYLPQKLDEVNNPMFNSNAFDSVAVPQSLNNPPCGQSNLTVFSAGKIKARHNRKISHEFANRESVFKVYCRKNSQEKLKDKSRVMMIKPVNYTVNENYQSKLSEGVLHKASLSNDFRTNQGKQESLNSQSQATLDYHE